MTSFPEWQDVRDGIVAELGGEEPLTGAGHRDQGYVGRHRLAGHSGAQGFPEIEAAKRMGATKSGVTQIECGEV